MIHFQGCSTERLLNRQRLKNSAEDEQCALFIIDLDDFKSVNDTLGHQAGDLAIRETARILSGLFHANDIISRFGGDEFLIFTSGRLTTEAIEDKGHEICKKLQISLSDSENVVLSARVPESAFQALPLISRFCTNVRILSFTRPRTPERDVTVSVRKSLTAALKVIFTMSVQFR